MFDLEPSWKNALLEELEKPYIANLQSFLSQEKASGAKIYPPEEQIFTALWKTPFPKVKVLIMGQDPYHGPGQAHGMCFSVNKEVKVPPSLQNIYKELNNDIGMPIPKHGNLTSWAEQGVLLLNATLTVPEGQPLAHHGKGWELFTDAIVKALCERSDPVIFVLWGNYAKNKCAHILKEANAKNHPLLTAAHPSPLSAYRGFFGCRHFSKINELLASMKKEPIDWKI